MLEIYITETIAKLSHSKDYRDIALRARLQLILELLHMPVPNLSESAYSEFLQLTMSISYERTRRSASYSPGTAGRTVKSNGTRNIWLDDAIEYKSTAVPRLTASSDG